MNRNLILDEASRRGMSQNELARQIGVSNGQLSFILHGKREMRLKHFKKLCEILQKDPKEVW